jgi:hypothetical protein
VLERFPSFFEELSRETTRGRTTFEEVEESEADLARFRSWISKIRTRDYFAAPLYDQVRDELARAEEAMTRFAEAAMLTSEFPDHGFAETKPNPRRLRST